MERDVLEVTAFERAHDYGEFFKARYGPTIAVHVSARPFFSVGGRWRAGSPMTRPVSIAGSANIAQAR